jgi:predicted transcriptional regulator of viral defense system
MVSTNDYMPSPIYNRIAEIAADNYGYITTDGAEAAGINPDRLLEMARRGQIERRSNALYRVPLIPPTPFDPYREATLWPRGLEAAISHETALDLYGLSDVNPAKIDITVSRSHRPRREIPAQYRLHHEDLHEDEVTLYEGIPIVTAGKAIRQSQHLGPALLRQAIAEARRRGLVSSAEADRLGNDAALQRTR